MGRETRAAFVIAWLVISAVLLAVLAAPFLLDEAAVARLAPVCEWKAKYGRECVLCGMTTAFLLISDGLFYQAHLANRGSLPLYGFFLCNQLAAALFLVRRLKGIACKF